jgi:deazaflavin-dependent oxidoreductase (nitroreductase family)
MRILPNLWDVTGGALLMRSGRAGRLTTVGRKSGQPRTVQCGFVPREYGTLLVGSAKGRQWPANLAAAGSCTFEARGFPARRYDAIVLEGVTRADALEEIRRARGERALGMFNGHLFELRPTDGSSA